MGLSKLWVVYLCIYLFVFILVFICSEMSELASKDLKQRNETIKFLKRLCYSVECRLGGNKSRNRKLEAIA